jgi:pilus assembly protein Flp/PilA
MASETIQQGGKSIMRYVNFWMSAALARLDELKQREEGQALVEYALILALVSVVAVAILGTIGTNVVTKLTDVANAL